jgi:hypothetical protein
MDVKPENMLGCFLLQLFNKIVIIILSNIKQDI